MRHHCVFIHFASITYNAKDSRLTECENPALSSKNRAPVIKAPHKNSREGMWVNQLAQQMDGYDQPHALLALQNCAPARITTCQGRVDGGTTVP
jgi:hypothetical protein